MKGTGMVANKPKNNSKRTHSDKFVHKKTWIIIAAVGIFVAIAVFVIVLILQNSRNKISDAYNKCKEEFVAIESSAEETNDNKYDATIFFKPDTSKETLESLSRIMSSFAKVKDVVIATGEEEYQKSIDENEDISDVATDDEVRKLMLDSMNAIMRVKAYDPSDLSSIKNVVENNSEFKKYIDSDRKPIYDETPPISFGTLELLDDGKTIVMEIKKDNYADKIGCVCSTLNMPDRLKDAIGQTVTSDGVRRDEWGDINVEWSYRNEKLHIVIYQK